MITTVNSYDLVVVGGTPGGVMSAIAAARNGLRVALLERTEHVGGLVANGLGATDIATRGATLGLFHEFVSGVRKHYVTKYGEGSEQVRVCSNGYHFEPHVAQQVLNDMIRAEGDRIRVLLCRQFDADPRNVDVDAGMIRAVRVTHRAEGRLEQYAARFFIDATYEGDLSAAAGVPYRLGRESRSEYGEEMAGVIYRAWPHAEPAEGTTGFGDNAIQSYNYRLCLTDVPENRVQITKPDAYNRDEYASLVDDILHDRYAGAIAGELELDGIGRVVNIVRLPNGKTDANNQHLGFLSTDLPEENWPWPTSSWDWRDAFAKRLRNYILGLIYFVQNDEALPRAFRDNCRKWGLAKDEYADNGHFPRQVYVREGRRVCGEYTFSALDATPVAPGNRPPVHHDSITASHYAIDSHACRKREPGRVHLEGFLSYPVKPYTIPFGVMVPQRIDNLLTPVPLSATHCGFGTLRMEPCWMALGQAAGTAAALCVWQDVAPRRLDIEPLQRKLLEQNAVLIHFPDSPTPDPDRQLKTLAAHKPGGSPMRLQQSM